MRARVIKIISNQYRVALEDGSEKDAFCIGKMRQKDRIVVGDFVKVEEQEEHYAIVDVEERKNILKRPFLANVDQAYVVMSMKDPDFSYELVNRLIFMIEYAKVEPIVLLTKCDLCKEEEIKTICDYYQGMGYRVFATSHLERSDELIESLKDRVSVLCGQSGVGKSSLLNVLKPDLSLATDVISKALGRGKHTTRHVELYEVYDGLLADTPGFSSLDLYGVDIDTLKASISAFQKFGDCYFRDCKHLNEPDCVIKEAVVDGKIPESFYKTYVDIVKMIGDNNFSANNHRRLK